MIIEIALGIVLAVLILRYLEVILSLGVIVFVLGLVAVFIGILGYWGYRIFSEADSWIALAALVGGLCIVIRWEIKNSQGARERVRQIRQQLGYDLDHIRDVRNETEPYRLHDAPYVVHDAPYDIGKEIRANVESVRGWLRKFNP